MEGVRKRRQNKKDQGDEALPVTLTLSFSVRYALPPYPLIIEHSPNQYITSFVATWR